MEPGCIPSRQGLYDPRYEHDACGVGFVVDVKGRKSHNLVQTALTILVNLEHRGASGCDKETGDGAGILLQMPDRFLRAECDRLGLALPPVGRYGAGVVFLPVDEDDRRHCEQIFERIAKEENRYVVGWRDVPTDGSSLGRSAKAAQPVIRQIFISADLPGTDGGPASDAADPLAFERKLYVIRKRAEHEVRASSIRERHIFYVPSLSTKTIVYKGMLRSSQVASFYADLRDPRVETALALVHSRFSTNTFPSWPRAHPYRHVCHNGEINTLRGNINWMRARESLLQSRLFGPDLQKILPVIDEAGSDSAAFDNVLEFLVLAGRPLAHVVMMMIPEPWAGHESMGAAKKAFYEYHGCLMEPWDGPALIAITDGTQIGAVLDRNGLRPARYYVTTDDLVVLASEVGVLDLPPERIVRKGRLEPGRMFLVDLQQGRIVDDDEIKQTVAGGQPYDLWLQENLVALEDLPEGTTVRGRDSATLLQQQQAFGYTSEDLKLLMTPMALEGNEALGSMGDDAALAVLSDRPQLLYSYFKQLFAQVTNPPVDAIREALITAVDTTIGPEGNLLEVVPRSARQIKLTSPILRNEELAKLRRLDGTPGSAGSSPRSDAGFRSITLSILYPVADGEGGLRRGLDELFQKASDAVAAGYNIIIISDRGINRRHAAIPALLAVAGLHHHLIREGIRTKTGLVLESGEPREVHHLALLIGYGAGAINPYLAFEILADMIRRDHIEGIDYQTAVDNYTKAINKGVLKVMSKMGISTVRSYCGAQIFEAIGLDSQVIDQYFTATTSRVNGVGLDVIADEVRRRHQAAFGDGPRSFRMLESGGRYQHRGDGEYHLFNPQTIHKLQHACRSNRYDVFKQYSELVDDQSRRMCTLRGLLQLQFADRLIPMDEVESVESIVKRFKSGAMSYGSISQEAHETLAIAMNRIGGKSNTGEGGEDPARYSCDANGDTRNSAIKQVASARFGVTSEYLVNAQELQIKISQGAKPGEGGQLPGHKVYPWIAKVRHATPGVGLISPPPHHDVYSIEDLAELIHDLKNANHRARISVKLVAEVGVGTIAAGVAKAHADVVLISGHDGGTGAAPLTSIKHAGIPWELGLAETHQVLALNDLRSRIVVEVDGQLKTGRDVVIAALLGAEEFGFATAPLVAMGCVMMRVCHLNTCPVGIATQDPRLRKKFTGDPAHVVNFMRFVAQEVRELMARLGFRTFDEMVGRSDRLKVRDAIDHFKARKLDFSQILHQPAVAAGVGLRCLFRQDHGLERALDNTTLLPLCRPALEESKRVTASLPIRNIHRAVGTMVGSEITRRYGARGLPDETIRLHFKGAAGQSFGAFIPRGMTLVLEGDANDYTGKGLSGGKIVVYPPAGSIFKPEENVIVGNVAFYGATSGEAYIRGVAGERFCVRNSGAIAVVEGIGDHGCEYMTGGRVVVLGATGRNFAAGMSGGIAYVLDESGDFSQHCNQEMVTLFPLDDSGDVDLVRGLIRTHAEHTQSKRAWRILALWDEMLPRFVKIYPNDYRRTISKQEQLQQDGLTEEEAVLAAFEANARDIARMGGK
jgi:glutamate synthase (ferredoxin)